MNLPLAFNDKWHFRKYNIVFDGQVVYLALLIHEDLNVFSLNFLIVIQVFLNFLDQDFWCF